MVSLATVLCVVVVNVVKNVVNVVNVFYNIYNIYNILNNRVQQSTTEYNRVQQSRKYYSRRAYAQILRETRYGYQSANNNKQVSLGGHGTCSLLTC